MSPSDPTAQALAYLQAELDFLQGITPASQAAIGRKLAGRPVNVPPGGWYAEDEAAIARMIKRALEMEPIFAEIWSPAHVRPHHERGGLVFLAEPVPGWPEAYTPEQFNHELSMERRRLLSVIIGTAAKIPGLAKHRRDALRELPDLLDDFGRHAQALARTLERINSKELRGCLMLPGWFTHSPIELMHRAAEDYGPDSYELTTRDELDSIACRYDRHLPTLQAMIDSLATVTRAELEHAEPFGNYRFKRKHNPMADYAGNLLEALKRSWNVGVFLQPLEFTAAHLVTIAAVMTDTDPGELPEGIERRMREILQEHRAADPPG
ncbi:MAG: hypothetical protein ACKN9W_03850 [Methylococcus sp.]